MNWETKMPKCGKAKLMLWRDISYHDMEVIDKIKSIPELENAVCRALAVDPIEPKRGLLQELYVQTILFCRECDFKPEQTSTLLSIVKALHEVNLGSSPCNLEEYFEELLLCHSVRRPPFSMNLFSFKEADLIFKYMHSSYLRNYKFFRYIFIPQDRLNLSLTYIGPPVMPQPSVKGNSSVEIAGGERTTESKENETNPTPTTQETMTLNESTPAT